MLRQRLTDAGFAALPTMVLALVIVIVSATGIALYRHSHNAAVRSDATPTSQSTSQQTASSDAQPAQTAQQYLVIKEWGLQIPLPDSIKDAYYVVPSGISDDPDGKPSGVYVGVSSLDGNCGAVTGDSAGIDHAIGGITRVPTNYTDPVSSKLYTEKYPNGVTIGGYYYVYAGRVSGKTCAPQSKLQAVDNAFGSAAKGAAAAAGASH